VSASTIATRAKLGEATMRAFHARSQEMLAERRSLVERRVAERRSQYAGRGAGTERLAELAGRCDALAGLLPEERLDRVREGLERTAQAGRADETAGQVEQLEREAERIAEERLRREVLLETVAAANQGELLSEIEWDEDGSLSATVGFPDEVQIRVTVSGDPAGDGTETVAWHTAESNIAEQAAAAGTGGGCAAELDYVDRLVASSPEMSFDERSRAEAEAAAAEEDEEEDAGWEELEA
jgi:hypothetical protein